MEIEQKIALYCHAIDLRDFDLLDELFLLETSFDFTRGSNRYHDWVFMKMRDHWSLAQAITTLEPSIRATINEPIDGFVTNGECDVAYRERRSRETERSSSIRRASRLTRANS